MDLVWAYTMVEESFQLSITMFEKNTHETTIERDLKKIHEYIIENPGITARKVLRKFHMKGYDFRQLLDTLVERGDIDELVETGYRNKKVKKYFAISL
jgi:predicted HTH transcriptional regulator